MTKAKVILENGCTYGFRYDEKTKVFEHLVYIPIKHLREKENERKICLEGLILLINNESLNIDWISDEVFSYFKLDKLEILRMTNLNNSNKLAQA